MLSKADATGNYFPVSLKDKLQFIINYQGSHPVKILFINNDKGWGGGQEFLLELAGELVNHEYDIHFVVRSGSISEQRFGDLGFTIHTASHDLNSFYNLAKVLRQEHFNVVSINREHDIPLAVIARFMASPFSPPGKLVMNYHIPVARRQPFLGAMEAIVCVSEHICNSLLQSYPDVAKKIKIISNGIRAPFPAPEEKFTPDRRRRYFQNSSFPLIGMVGAFWKNQTELVECIPALCEKFPDIRVAFVGDNTDIPLVTPVIERIRELDVESHVIFTGKVPREHIPDIFFDLDVSVSTHRNEGFGIVHLESLAAGTPVVSFNAGGVRDILAGSEVGVLVDGGTVEFTREIAALLSNDERRYKMGRAGVELVQQRFSNTTMGQSYRMFLDQLCQK